MTEKKLYMCDGNEAASDIAYRTTELAIIYPITPSSPMAENYEMWSDKGLKNIFNETPEVSAMQSEAGAIGAVHGALQVGALTTTFTASQGLLLMIPNMYKIAGELLPFVMHVSARTLASHALSIFGDHSDVMACRATGFAMLASNSPGEAHDMALIAHTSTLKSSVPFLHFFDGFRTSHEINMIERIDNETIIKMTDMDKIEEFKKNALTPETPNIRGTAQNPDVFFQAREASNPFYNNIEDIVREKMKQLETLTGRSYNTVDYVGSPNAEHVIVAMGSACETIEETIKVLNATGDNLGLIKIRLYRPFPAKTFLEKLPKTTKKISILDRTKEPGALAEPLYLDVATTLKEANRCDIFTNSGRYGISSKEFTPNMVVAIFDELKKSSPSPRFTVGINDDLTNLSLNYNNNFKLNDSDMYQALFYGLGSDGTVGANKNSIKIITSETNKFGQAYFEYDSKKSGGTTTSHLRFSDHPIRAPYLINDADFTAVHHFPLFYTLDMTSNIKNGGILLINSPFKKEDLWQHLPSEVQTDIINKKLKVFAIGANVVARDSKMGRRINTIMQTAFFHLAGVIESDKAIKAIKKAIEKTYSKKGAEIVEMNFKAVDNAIENIYAVNVPNTISTTAKPRPQLVSSDAHEVFDRLLSKIILGKGNDIPVSAFEPSGKFPTATSKYEKRGIAESVPLWNNETCIECGKCAFICPHGAIRTKVMTDAELKNAPNTFRIAKYKTKELGENLNYVVQVSPLDCTGCGLCVSVCPTKPEASLKMTDIKEIEAAETENFKFFETIPYIDREKLNLSLPKHTQLLEPLFEYSGACSGCGEAGYIKLITQLFGDRMMIANATGCSSIYGGNLPTTPYSKNDSGCGPSWSNSLFEDNAEYGYGQAVATQKAKQTATNLLKELAPTIGDNLVSQILENPQSTEAEIKSQREYVKILKEKLSSPTDIKSKMLLTIANFLIKKSLWIFGGDGWAYDIGYGGLDHVLNMKENINILVLDTEVYSNTGGQQSKSTPRGASAKFATSGRELGKKDLGLVAIANGGAYVAKIAMSANETQTIKAIREAESFDGPSLILAYSPCIAHGIDLLNGPAQARAAVASGHWPLYRYDPRLVASGKAPLQLDSQLPTISLRDYMLKEGRYKSLATSNPEKFDEMVKQREYETNYKSKFLQYLSNFKMEE